MFSTTVASDIVSQENKFTNAETDDEIHEVLFKEAISKQEVIASIDNLKAGKSAGPGKVPLKMLKHVNEVVTDFFVEQFNKLFDCGTSYN